MSPHGLPPSSQTTIPVPGGNPFALGPLHQHSLSHGPGHVHGESAVHFLRYGVDARLEVGLGYWETTAKPRPAIAWQLLVQDQNRPAVLVGYGSEPMGRWKDDGVYLSLVKGFGPPTRRQHVFLAYFREIGGATNHLMGGINQPLGPRWSLFVGHYPFNTWEGSASYQLSSRVQLGLWAGDFGRSPRFGFSVGTGWQIGRPNQRKREAK